MPFEMINGMRIYYETHGTGDTIVLLHHGFGCTKIWKHIYPRFVEKGYRVVMYDRRGYGQSERGADFIEFYTSNTFRSESVKELAMLRKLLDIDSFHIIGQCEGGVVGIDYAAMYPQHVTSIVVSATQCYSKITLRELNSVKFPKPFKDLEPEVKKKMIDWHGEQYAELCFNQFRKYGGSYGVDFFDLREVLPSVGCPAIVLYPDRSFLFDVEQAVTMYRGLPKGELAVLPHCGHNTYEQQPEEYISCVLNFLKRHNY